MTGISLMALHFRVQEDMLKNGYIFYHIRSPKITYDNRIFETEETGRALRVQFHQLIATKTHFKQQQKKNPPMKNESTNCLFVDTKELVVNIDFLGKRF